MTNREEAIERWQAIQVLSAMLTASHGMPASHTEVGRKKRELGTIIKNLRSIMKERPSVSRYREREESLIKAEVHRIVLPARSPVYLSVHVGGNAWAKRTVDKSRYSKQVNIEMHVGWGWRRKVYEPFYKEPSLISEWFVLAAEEVKVNHKMLRLFEAVVYDRKSDTTRQAYIVKAKWGKERADLKFSAGAAIAAGEALIAEEIAEKIVPQKGE